MKIIIIVSIRDSLQTEPNTTSFLLHEIEEEKQKTKSTNSKRSPGKN